MTDQKEKARSVFTDGCKELRIRCQGQGLYLRSCYRQGDNCNIASESIGEQRTSIHLEELTFTQRLVQNKEARQWKDDFDRPDS